MIFLFSRSCTHPWLPTRRHSGIWGVAEPGESIPQQASLRKSQWPRSIYLCESTRQNLLAFSILSETEAYAGRFWCRWQVCWGNAMTLCFHRTFLARTHDVLKAFEAGGIPGQKIDYLWVKFSSGFDRLTLPHQIRGWSSGQSSYWCFSYV